MKTIVRWLSIPFLCLSLTVSETQVLANEDFDDLLLLLDEIDSATGVGTGGIDSLVTNNVSSFFYHPSSQLSLGKGMGDGNPVTYRKRCFDVTTTYSQPTTSAIETKFTRTEIRSYKELRETLNFSGSISARLKFANKAGGDVSLSFASGHTFSEESLMIILKMEANYSQQELDEIEVREKYQGYLDGGDFDRFTRSCGSHLVTSVDRKAMVFAVIRSDNMSESVKQEIKASLGMSADLPFASGEVKVDGQDLFEREQKSGTLSISFHAIGGAGPQQLGQLATAHSIEDIQGAFKNYLENFNNDNVPAIVFNVTPMSDILPEHAANLESRIRNINGALERLLDEFELITLELGRLKAGLVGGRLPDDSKVHYKQSARARLKRRDQLQDIARKFLYQKGYIFAEDPEYADTIVDGELPRLDPIRWYEPELMVHQGIVTLSCDRDNDCTTNVTRWTEFNSQLRLSLNISPVAQVETVELQAVFADGRIVDIPNSKRTREEINQGSIGGVFTYRMMSLSPNTNLDWYVKFRREKPIFSLKVVRADKTEQIFRLDDLKMDGNHR